MSNPHWDRRIVQLSDLRVGTAAELAAAEKALASMNKLRNDYTLALATETEERILAAARLAADAKAREAQIAARRAFQVPAETQEPPMPALEVADNSTEQKVVQNLDDVLNKFADKMIEAAAVQQESVANTSGPEQAIPALLGDWRKPVAAVLFGIGLAIYGGLRIWGK